MQKLGPRQTEWIEALESGKFKQGSYYLCKRPKKEDEWQYCCLGVAEELMVSYLTNPPYCSISEDNKEELRVYDGVSETISEVSMDELSLNSDVGAIIEDRISTEDLVMFRQYIVDNFGLFDIRGREKKFISLAFFNDSGLTFKQIAEILRTYPHYFFRVPK